MSQSKNIVKKVNSGLITRWLGDELSFTELCYFLGTAILIGLKAIGLEEYNMFFRATMIVGFAFILIKLFLENHRLIEWGLILVLLSYGIWAVFTSKSVGLLILLFLLVGMKNINIGKLFRCIAVEYVVCFILTVIAALVGIKEGVVLVHEKFGFELVRRSLGYTHPNVLHITYVVIMALIFYAVGAHGKDLIRLTAILAIIDVAVFACSLSFTGMVMSVALFIAVWYVELFHNKADKSINKVEGILLRIWVPFTVLGFIALAKILELIDIKAIYDPINDLFNKRIWCINVYTNYVGYSLFGKSAIYEGAALDCSYAYGLFKYGIMFILLMLVSYYFTMRYLIKKNRYMDIAIMVVFLFAGMSEQFLFNASVKNLTVFMVGEWMYDALKMSEQSEWKFYERRWCLRDIWFRKIVQRRIFHKFLHREPVMPWYAERNVLGIKKTNDIIADMIDSGKPFMISRFGNTELQMLVLYLERKLLGDSSIDSLEYKKWHDRLLDGAGFFPDDNCQIEQFDELYLKACQDIDLLGMWHCNMEDYVISKYMQNTQLTFISYLEPWNATNPWTRALKGKKVLVIHPFEDSIKKQYLRRNELFDNPNILPEFELKTLKAVQTLAGNRDDRFDTWFEALDYMVKKAMEIDFDIAIIGCGAYGMPLAAKLKEAGKQAFHLGGVTQILFGIKGKRWTEYDLFKVKFNDTWVYPDESERPKGIEKVEGGCYWR